MSSCPGALLLEVDLARAEWVVTAYTSEDQRMIEVVEEGVDAHIRTAELITGVPAALIQQEDRFFGHTTDAEELRALRKEHMPRLFSDSAWFLPRSMTCRQAGKKSNHALNYRMGPDRFSLENEVDLVDAKRMVSAYRDKAYAGLKKWYRRIDEQLRRNRTLTNCLGQKRVFLDRWSTALLMDATPWEPQSTVATVTNRGLRRLYALPSSVRYEPLGQVHDSVPGQCWPRSWAELADIGQLVSDALKEPLVIRDRPVTIERELKIGPNWRDMKSVQPQEGEPLADALERTWAASF